jgi:hypothetical protein
MNTRSSCHLDRVAPPLAVGFDVQSDLMGEAHAGTFFTSMLEETIGASSLKHIG